MKDYNLTEKEINEKVEQAKKIIKEKVIADHEVDDDTQEIMARILEEAKMPIELKNEDFKMGERELDIRGLSSKNRDQMLFRMLVLNNVYQRQNALTLIDIMRLMMILLKQMGVENIEKAIDDLIQEQTQKIKQPN